jgi:ATP-dependent Clp protease ATP-binding subunit ClpA
MEHIVSSASTEASNRGHEYVTLEHVLFILLKNEQVRQLCLGVGGDLKTLDSDIEEYLNNTDYNGLKSEGGSTGTPRPTTSVERVLQRAFTQVVFTGREEITELDVLISLCSEKESQASYFLQANNVNRTVLVNAVVSEDANGELDGSFLKNLNQEVIDGGVDPLIGRHEEVREVVEVLARRKKNNCVLVGEPGTGKTAIAEGIAYRIVNKDIPEALQGKQVYNLDIGSMVAGTKFRGDFEERMKNVLEGLEGRDDVILFIDEIHQIMGAGSAGSSSLDVANILKPVLGKGKLQTIGATTPDEFANSFEKDRALMRRFQRLEVEAMNISDTIEVCKGLQPLFEDYHGVMYDEGTIEKIVTLSEQYIKNKALPDKAIDVLDQAGAVSKLDKVPNVSMENVFQQVAKISKVSKDMLDVSQKDSYKTLDARIKDKVFGQDDAIDKMVESILVSKAGLREHDKPIGSFLLVGPTGVGKTETAKRLSECLDVELVRFDMSEYMERHSVSKLIGAPPGYVGHAEGELGQGLLLSEVEKHPNCILLLDEVEKAAPEVLNVLLQIMDDGRLTGSTGKTVSFNNAILLMTSNLGAADAEKLKVGFGEQKKKDTDVKAVKTFFTPEFRNRIDSVVKFNKLGMDQMYMIIDRLIDETNELLQGNDKDIRIVFTPLATEELAKAGYEPTMGARPLKRVFEEKVKKPLSKKIIYEEAEHKDFVIDYKDGDFVIG